MDDAVANAATLPTPAAPAPTSADSLQRRNRRLLRICLGVVAFAGLFCYFVLVPLYGILCEATGSQMQPNNPAVAAAAPVATGRHVEVFFESKVFDDLPVRFTAEHQTQRVEVGQDARNLYRFQNLSDRTIHFRPVHQVSPSRVAEHFGMKVCFCFNDQTLGPGESAEYPVVYTFAPELDARVKDVTICYSLLAVVEGEDEKASLERLERKTGAAGGVVTPRFKAVQEEAP